MCEHKSIAADGFCNNCWATPEEVFLARRARKETPLYHEMMQDSITCIHELPFNKCPLCATSDWQVE